MKVSICIATRNHAPLLRRTLASIFQQSAGCPFEVIIADDGSTDETAEMLHGYPVRYFRLENGMYRNGVFAKNVALRAAVGEIIVQQSDDVLHATPAAIAELTANFDRGVFRVATVYDWNSQTGETGKQYTGRSNPRPLFFLGAVRREDVCAVGGYDPDFAAVCWYDDDWHADGLLRGRGLRCVHVPVVGLHQDHFRPAYDPAAAKAIYREKTSRARIDGRPEAWLSSGGPWRYVRGKAVDELGNI